MKVIEEKVYTYITSDGKHYSNKKLAEEHEKSLQLEKQKRDIWHYDIITPDDDLATIWHIKDEKEKEFLEYVIWKKNGSIEDYDGPGWYIAFRHDGGDYADSFWAYKIDNYLTKIKDYIAEIEEMITE